jgi:hypothetical protein
MKNVSQTIQVKALTLVTQNKITPEIRLKLEQAGKIKDDTDEEKIRLLKEIHEEIPPEIKEELISAGVDSLLANVNLTLTLGDFFFDLLMSVKVPPQAPLKMAYHQKQVQELAARLQSDTLDITANDLAQVRSVLDDDQKWARVNVNAAIDMKGATREAIKLTSNGVTLFGDILAASIDVFEQEKIEYEKTKKDKKVSKKKKVKKKVKKS